MTEPTCEMCENGVPCVHCLRRERDRLRDESQASYAVRLLPAAPYDDDTTELAWIDFPTGTGAFVNCKKHEQVCDRHVARARTAEADADRLAEVARSIPGAGAAASLSEWDAYFKRLDAALAVHDKRRSEA